MLCVLDGGGEAVMEPMSCSLTNKNFVWARPDSPETPLGTRLLTGTACVASSYDCGSGKYCVEIKDCLSEGGTPPLILSGESESEMEAWVEAILTANGGVNVSQPDPEVSAESFHEFTVRDEKGSPTSLAQFAGKVCIFVNVATF